MQTILFWQGDTAPPAQMITAQANQLILRQPSWIQNVSFFYLQYIYQLMIICNVLHKNMGLCSLF
jgi:hypothetical protein